jgi:parvulin-like peptidyl-prolyl isomerase
MNKILPQKATEDEKTRTRDEVAKYLDAKRKAAPSEQVFQQEISASGKTLEQIQAAFLEKQLARAVLIRELAPSNAISDAAARNFYDDEKNATNFAIPELVHVAHILISVIDPATRQPLPPAQKREKENLAQEILAKAVKGEDFAALAKLYSDDTSTREQGGEYTFSRHSTAPQLEPFAAAAFSLKTNQISDLVETPYGYDIIKLLEKLPPSKRPFDQVSAVIRDYLADAEISKRLPAYIPKVEAEYGVKFLGPNYSPTPLVPPAAPPAPPAPPARPTPPTPATPAMPVAPVAPVAPVPFIGPPAPPGL